MKQRHWGLIASFVLLVLVPFAAAVSYLYMVAEDQYRSTSGFTVRSQEESSANDLLGGLVSFAGGSVASDSDILYEFIQSSEMVEAVNRQIDLREHYSLHWPRDWFFSIWPDASQEDLIWYWNRMVGVSYDSGTGLIEIEVRAFDADTAQGINRAIVAESQTRINELNRQAREDAMRYALADLDDAVELLKNAREAMTNFRLQSQIVDPETDIQTRMGVMTSLQQQLAEALVEYDLLRGTTTPTDPRLKDAAQRIEVIRERIAIERQNFATSSTETGGVNQDYPSLIAEYERLTVDREYAEQFYIASLTALEAARDEANRQSRYLATYIQPTRAEDAQYPQRDILAGLTGLFLILAWSILALIYYSIRDRS
ncbi:MAG: sugar transporter [Roseovarius sp.]